VTPLERRYRRWLVTYPARYRRERESEILDTLLEAAPPGQDRPSAREVVALLAGGLKARARLVAGSPHGLWAEALRLGVAASLAGTLAFGIAMWLVYWPLLHVTTGQLAHPEFAHLGTVTVAVAVVAVARAKFLIGLGAIVAGLLIQLVTWHVVPPSRVPLVIQVSYAQIFLGVAVALLAAYPRLRSGTRAWSWRLTSVVLVAVMVESAYILTLHAASPPQPLWFLASSSLVLVPAALLIALAVVGGDPRLALGATVFLGGALVNRAQTLLAFSLLVAYPWASFVAQTAVIGLMAAGALATTVALQSRSSAGLLI
jgi:hypothetical protein